MAAITVFAERFSEGEPSRYRIGEFDSYNEALTVAARRVDAELLELHKPGQSARELMELWTTFGEDTFLVPDDAHYPFSALDFVRLRCLTHTGDPTRPLLYEVVCTDRINTATGFSSPPQQWQFRVRAPETYAGAEHLLRRATEVLYEDMSQQAMLSDGSTYTLLHFETHLLSAEEAAQAALPAVSYTVQPDGSFQKALSPRH
jgi:hypothetical protein